MHARDGKECFPYRYVRGSQLQITWGNEKLSLIAGTSVSFVSQILIFLPSYVFDLLAVSVFINDYNDLGIFGLLRKTIFASNVSAYGIYLFDKVNLINQKSWLSFRCLTWRTPDVAYFRVELPYSLSYEQYKRAVRETEVNCQKIQHTVNIRPKMDQDQAAVMQYLHVPITLSSNEDDSHFRRVHYSFHEICLEYCIVIIAIGCFFAISTSSKFLLRGGHSEWSWMHLKFTCILYVYLVKRFFLDWSDIEIEESCDLWLVPTEKEVIEAEVASQTKEHCIIETLFALWCYLALSREMKPYNKDKYSIPTW